MTISTCPLGITDATLSEWRDGTLDAAQTQRLRDHLHGCVACQQRTGGFDQAQRALRTQSLPDLQNAIWRDLRPRLVAAQPVWPLARWGAIGGGIALLLVAALTLSLLGQPGRLQPISIVPSPTLIHAPTATDQPTATGTPAPLTTDQAWGTAGTHVIPIGPDHFTVSDLLPDGSGAVGMVMPTQANARPQVAMYLWQTQTLTILHTMPTADDIPHVVTDGRYIAWVGAFVNSFGPNTHQEVGYYDLVTHATTIFFTQSSPNYSAYQLHIDHGLLFLIKGTGLVFWDEINLATNTESHTIAGANLALISAPSLQWPYLLYENSNNTTHLLNISTGADQTLPQIVIAPMGDSPYISPILTGTTVIWSAPDLQSGGNNFYELDHADQPGATAHQFLHYDGGVDSIDGAANDRLVLWSNQGNQGTYTVWDRLHQRLVQVSVGSGPGASTLFVRALLHGHAFGYQVGDGATATFVLRDTATLP